MAERLAHTVEVELSAGVWTNVTADLRGEVTCEYGIPGGGPLDRCGSTGMMRFTLNNSPLNSGGKSGYYAPGHANCRAGFDVGVKVRWKASDTVALLDRWIHVGRIVRVEVVAGLTRERVTEVESVDWMDEAAAVNVSSLTTQTGKRADQILATLLTGLTNQPESTDFDAGDSTFTYALDNVQDETTRVLSTLSDLVNSEGSYAYLKGSGALVFESRTARALATTVKASFTDDMLDLVVGRTRDDLINVVLATVHPRRLDAAATTVLWSRDIANGEAPIEIGAGATLPTLLGQYGDPANGRARCGGTAMVTPVATTDYLMNAAADGSGTNLTASLSVTAGLGGNGVAWTLTNNAASTGYITKLQCRGKGIYDRAPVVVRSADATSIAQYGERTLRIDMPYQDDEAVAASFGALLLNLYSTTGSVPVRVGFQASQSASRLADALTVEVGDRVSITESVTGLAAQCFVNGCKFVAHAQLLRVEWALAPADAGTPWKLGIAGFSELGGTSGTTILGYG